MSSEPSPGPYLGRSEAAQEVLEFLERASTADVPVLLVGETGTGKSHLARLLHARSRRSGGPFVAVNCAGVPEGLFESEFFGHRRGAFTGAVASRPGLFETAEGGTLFLDEVGELPLSQQAKLLAVLEEGRVRPVGASRSLPVDARVVAATCRDLARDVEARAFRADLYHRIALLRCEVPPLRARPADLALMTRHILDRLARKYGRTGLGLDEEAGALVLAHPWPGNVRELAHALEAAVILSGARTLGRDHLARVLTRPPAGAAGEPGDLRPSGDGARGGRPEAGNGAGGRYSFFGSDEEEREKIREVLVRCRGNRTRAARELGMARNTLRDKLRKLGVEG